MTLFPLTTLAIIIALVVFIALGVVVGQARAKWSVPAPMSAGHPEFDKRFRVQMNTLEQLVLFLPAIWLAAPVLGDVITGALGLVWSIGRVLYARGYYADAGKRGPGYLVTVLPTLVFLVASVFGAVRVLIG